MKSETLTKIANDYFNNNEYKKFEVIKADFAYHRNHGSSKAHYFSGSSKDSVCRFCNRSRSDVRWDDLLPECSKRPEYMDVTIQSVIKTEELLYQRVLEKAIKIANSIDDVNTITGADISKYHHTYGVDPSMLECALLSVGKRLPEHIHNEYMIEYEKHSETGKRGQKKIVIKAKTI